MMLFTTVYQNIAADINDEPGIVEPHFNSTTLYLPGDHFKYNGQHYIVKECGQAGDEVWRKRFVEEPTNK